MKFAALFFALFLCWTVVSANIVKEEPKKNDCEWSNGKGWGSLKGWNKDNKDCKDGKCWGKNNKDCKDGKCWNNNCKDGKCWNNNCKDGKCWNNDCKDGKCWNNGNCKNCGKDWKA